MQTVGSAMQSTLMRVPLCTFEEAVNHSSSRRWLLGLSTRSARHLRTDSLHELTRLTNVLGRSQRLLVNGRSADPGPELVGARGQVAGKVKVRKDLHQ